MVHKYLFFIQKGEIRSYKWKEGFLLLVKYKGEEFCSVKDLGFWKWWEESNSFLPSEDSVDFCIMGDDVGDFYNNTFPSTETSSWDLDKIEAFLGEHFVESKIQLNDLNKGSTILLSQSPQAYKHEKTVNLNYITIPVIIEEKPIEEQEQTFEGKSSLRSYYLKELQKIK